MMMFLSKPVRFLLTGILLSAALAFSLAANAQDYPGKPIKIIVPFPPGSQLDAVARILAEKMQGKWGQPALVENRAGAAGNIGAESVSRAAPDGYALLMTSPAPLVINKSLYAKLAYDPEAFVPVSLVSMSPNVLVASPKVAADGVQQLIAFARANPDRLNYASSGVGTTSHLSSELFKSMAGLRIVHVPYKGVAPATLDLIAGRVDMLFAGLGISLSNVRAGKLRAFAVGSEKRHPALPEVPAMSEALPGFLSMVWYGMVAPPGTPSAIANKLSSAVAEVLKLPDVAKKLLDMNEMSQGSTPSELALFLKQEQAQWGGVIRASGATASD